MSGEQIAWFAMTIVILIFSIAIHEWAHAFTADKVGDTTPRSQGRVTLWPFAHLDPLGTLMMVLSTFAMVLSTFAGVGIGWGKPVQTDPRQYNFNPRIAGSLVTFAGPLSNLVIAQCVAFLYNSQLITDNFYNDLMLRTIMINLSLFLFNLIPVTPLDGSWLLTYALPQKLAEAYQGFMQKAGIFIFLALIFTGALQRILVPPLMAIMRQMIG